MKQSYFKYIIALLLFGSNGIVASFIRLNSYEIVLLRTLLGTHYYIDAESGLELPSIVLLEQLRTVDKRRLGDFIGHLSEKHIYGINHALAVSIGLIESVPKKLILCLCSACADNFYGTGAYSLRRIDPQQTEKDTCTYCNQRKGYDYEIIPKNR